MTKKKRSFFDRFKKGTKGVGKSVEAGSCCPVGLGLGFNKYGSSTNSRPSKGKRVCDYTGEKY